MPGSASDLGRHMEAVARALLGVPNQHLSSKAELRFGSHGSVSVDLSKGTWFDHEHPEIKGGGVLDLIEHKKALTGPEAFAFMREELGLDLPDDRPRTNGHAGEHHSSTAKPRKIVAEYDYVDENGERLFQVVRLDPKDFRQRRPDPTAVDGWTWKVKGVRQVPYRLPELVEAISEDRVVLVVEGEKDVDNLAKWGIPATCNAGGAGKWHSDLVEHFRGADVVMLPDNDEAGHKHAAVVGAALREVAKSVRALDLPGLQPKGDVSDWIADGGTPERLYQLLERALEWTPDPFVSKFGAVAWGEPRGNHEVYEYLVKGLIPRRELVLIYGASQSGKSFWTYDLAMSVVRAIPYRGCRVRSGFIIYCAAEAGLGFVDLRMPAYGQRFGVATDRPLPFVCLTKKFDLFGNEAQLIELIAEIKHHSSRFSVPLEAVVIDTLNKTTPGMDEIHGKDVGLVMSRLDQIRSECDCGLWLVHHKNAAGTGPRGHTSLFAAFETAIEISKTTETIQDGTKTRPVRSAKIIKQREGEDGREIRFALALEVIGKDQDGDDRTSCVVVPVGDDAAAPPAPGFKLDATEEALFRSLLEALAERGVPPVSQNIPLPKAITAVVEFREVRARYKARILQTDDDVRKHDERVRKQIQRAGAALKKYQVIGVANNWVWWTGKPVRGARGAIAGGDTSPTQATDDSARYDDHDPLSGPV